MKTRFIKSLLAMVLMWIALPMMGQDFLNIYFKDGTTRKFYLRGVTEISTSQYNASGVRYSNYEFQHVKTPYNDYVYNLSDIDSIAFSKFDETKTRQDFSSAMKGTIQSLSECESIGEAEKMLGQIKATSGVEDAWSDGHELFVKINNWETISFHFNHDVQELLNETENTVRQIRGMIPQLSKEFGRPDRQPRVVIANQQHYDESRSSYIYNKYLPLLDDFAACGFDTCYIDRPTIDFFATEIYKYDFIFVVTHGGFYGKKIHGFLTGEVLGEVVKTGDDIPEDTYNEWFQALVNLNENTMYENTNTVYYGCSEETKGESTYWVGHPRLYETFFALPEEGGIAKGTFPDGSILFNTACHSMEGYDMESSHSFAKKFTDRNLGAYYGYNASVYRGKEAGYEFFESLLNGKATGTAYVELPESLRVEKDKPECAVLTKYAQEGKDLLWIGPLVTRPLDNEEATKEYRLNNKLVLSASMTTINPQAIDQGFKYGTQKHNLTENVYADLVMKTLNTGEGNYLYQSAVTGLEQNTNYFYCAYTYDGVNYHYGDTLKFCIGTPEDLQITVKELNMSIDEAYIATVTTGSGQYMAESSDDEVATVSIDGRYVTVEAVGIGPATITVTDSETDQTATIEVTVSINNLPRIPAAAIDLGLPSGTLWASYNIGASKPEEMGGYYAWGETIENGVYDWKNYGYSDDEGDKFTDLGSDIAGTSYDVAKEMWGGDWRMPTYDQFEELLSKCTSKWTSRAGVNGIDFIGPNGAVVFFPATGYYVDGILYNVGLYGSYWSSTLYENYDRDAYYLNMSQFANIVINCDRHYGCCVRPVINGTPAETVDLVLASTDPISMVVGESITIKIISGNGQYTIKNSNQNAVSAVYKDNAISLTALQPGEATITVIDDRTDKKACFDVTVSKKLVDLVLSTDDIKMNLTAGATFIIRSGNGAYEVKSSNEAVATVALRGNYVDVNAVAAGTAVITVTDVESGQKATVNVTIVDNTPMPNTPAEAVDLGLPSGTLWASYNLGATYPEDYGRYFAWGETTTKAGFEWEGYEYYNSTDGWIYIGNDISGTEYDVASKLWGESWKMPTADQFRELKENCTIKETEVNGVYGRLFTGKNGNSIFLPAGGSFTDYENKYKGYYGYYWSSTLSSSYKGSAQILFFKKRGELMIGDDGRSNGVSIRPVTIAEKPVPDLVLEITEPISLKTGESKEIKIISGSNTYTLESSNEAVATADISDWVSLETMEKGKSVNVRAVGVGTATITVTDIHSGQRATVNVTVSEAIVAGEAIDLGLPSGTKWADRNVGASSPEDYGGLYPWAMTEEVEAYGNYKWGYGDYGELTKYCTNSKYGTVDNKTVLDPEDDVACMTWGGQWCMPTLEQAKELVANCDSEWTTLNGVWGRKYTSKINGNSIFIPAAGYFAYETYYSKGSNGFYWLSTLDVKNPQRAYDLYLASGSTGTSANFRYHGNSVRPVTK